MPLLSPFETEYVDINCYGFRTFNIAYADATLVKTLAQSSVKLIRPLPGYGNVSF